MQCTIFQTRGGSVRYYAAVLAVALACVAAAPAQAAETEKTVRKTVVVTTGDEENCVALGESGDCKVITIGKDGEKRVVRLKGGQLLDLDAKVDTAARLKLLDARITQLKTTGQLKTDLAIKRIEVEKLELSGKPDAEVVAKKKEMNALKARLADAKLDYEQTVKKLVPEDMYELYMIGDGDETDLLELSLGLPAGLGKRIIKRIELRGDDDLEEEE
jgi:hypothetical protein